MTVCQRPKRAFIISTFGITLQLLTSESCVNALNGLLSFLRRQTKEEKWKIYICVNALNGLLSFLRT